MNHTVIEDRASEDFRFENRLNAVIRHCRIGKITQKRVSTDKFGILKWHPDTIKSDWWKHQFGGSRKCSCLPGQACGNAACPHAPIVTARVGAI